MDPWASATRQRRLSGVNLDGWLVTGARETHPAAHLDGFISEGDVARLASWRFTHVRVPFDEAVLDTTEGWAALDTLADVCHRHGLRCVLALRTAQGSLFQEAAQWERLAWRWEELAARYAILDGTVCYDLLDSPSPPDALPEETLRALGAARLSSAAAARPPAPGATGGGAWSALAQRITRAIRAIDPHGQIVVQAPRASPEGFAFLRPNRDAHTVYAYQCFAPQEFTLQPAPAQAAPRQSPVTYPGVAGGERWDRERLRAWMAPALDFARAYEATLYLAAFGVSAAAPRQAQLTWVRSLLGLCHAGGIGWAYWTYRALPGAATPERADSLERAPATGAPQGVPVGLVCDLPSTAHLAQFANPQRLDYDLLGVLQSEA